MADCEMKTDRRSEKTHPQEKSDKEAAEQHLHEGKNESMEIETDVTLPAQVQQEIDDLCHFVPEVTNHFVIIDKIGEGTFSSVFLARLKHHPDVKEMFALKHIIPTSHPNRILGELKCLQTIGGKKNIIGLELCLRNKDHIVIVMRYFPHHRFQDYFNSFDVKDMRDYMRNLLIALQRVHQFDVIHRDVKPSNFLHNTDTKQYALVDFGLAHDAPVKLLEANKNRPPFIKDPKAATYEKENEKFKAAEAKAGGKSKSNNSSTVCPPPSSTRPPLSPLRSPARSPQNEAAKAAVTGPQWQKSQKPKDAADVLLPPPPPPPHSSKVARQGKTLHGAADGGHGAESLRRVSSWPRRVGPQVTLSDDAVQKRKSSVMAAPSTRPIGHSPMACECYGRPMVCSICNARSPQSAQRAGTPGFRAPEVLMKHPQQSTAVDIWSVGVIFLSLLSGRYPFFRGNDDMTCLSQIISVLGTENMAAAAKTYDKLVTCRPVVRPLNLRSLCQKLRAAADTSSDKHSNSAPTDQWLVIPESAINLLKRLIDPNPATRITAKEALCHDFFREEKQ